jgi:hypothetical protein
MKSSTIAAILTFSVVSLAAPVDHVVSERASPFGKRSVTDAIKDCDNAADTVLCSNVVTTINQWDVSVNAVNDFLNNADNLNGQALTTAEETALQLAQLEPDFLAALQGVPNLDSTGTAAATGLGQVFPAVPGNLISALKAQQSVQETVDNINTARCGGSSKILDRIGDLWQAAAIAAGADTPGRPLGPKACLKNGGNVGDAFN